MSAAGMPEYCSCIQYSARDGHATRGPVIVLGTGDAGPYTARSAIPVPDAMEISGYVAPGFEPVAETFAALFTDHVQLGAGFAVCRGEEWLVDLWGGHTDAGRKRPWTRDTLVNVYSTTKGVTALAVALLVEDGALAYDAPVVRYWPEFAAGGKAAVTVSQLLAHEAGLAGLREPLAITDLYDWEAMVDRLARAVPLWPPGTAVGYHALTWGWLAGELIRRVSGAMPGAFIRERITAPLAADFAMGLDAAAQARAAELSGPNRAVAPAAFEPVEPAPRQTGPFFALAQENPIIRPYADASSTAWREAELPAANGHGTASALARIYSAVVTGSLLNAKTLAQATEDLGTRPELVLAEPLRRGRGLLLNRLGKMGRSRDAFGHDGHGGSTAFADPRHGIGVGYVMNQLEPPWTGRTRRELLVDALYRCLDGPSGWSRQA
jgi:CubicO group peptidase (beta-lactamase class C family)